MVNFDTNSNLFPLEDLNDFLTSTSIQNKKVLFDEEDDFLLDEKIDGFHELEIPNIHLEKKRKIGDIFSDCIGFVA